MFRRRVLRYAVAEVEHVPRAAAISLQDPAGLRADGGGRAEERHRIEVALQRHAVADAPPRFADGRLPVDAERIGPGVGHLLEPKPAALGEEDAGYDSPPPIPCHARQRTLRIFERELPER